MAFLLKISFVLLNFKFLKNNLERDGALGIYKIHLSLFSESNQMK